MKILTGFLRGQSIEAKTNPRLRPTADKVRKAIFDRFQDWLQAKRVLDLFSGTGALGIEALSLGASRVVFVEKDRAAAQAIEKNLEKLKIADRAQIRNADVFDFLNKEKQNGGGFDLVLLDPPYEKNEAMRALRELDSANVVAGGGYIVAEVRKNEMLEADWKTLEQLQLKNYGDSKIAIYRKK